MPKVPPPPSSEDFEQTIRGFAAQPTHVQVETRKIQLDLSLTGIIHRVQQIIDQGHAHGAIPAPEHAEMASALEKFRSALSRVDEAELLFTLQPRRPGSSR